MERQIILDTNIIYYITGLSNGPITAKEFSKYVRSQNGDSRYCISSVTLFELLAKYHKHANVFRRIMCMLRDYHIGILDNPHYKKISPFQKELAIINQKKLTSLWKEVKENKVDVEARYTTAVFSLVLSSGIVFESVDDVEAVPDSVYAALRVVLGLTRDIALDVFRDAFSDGYLKDDCEHTVKKCFSSLLQFLLPTAIALCINAAEWERNENGEYAISDTLAQEYKACINRIEISMLKQGAPTKFISKSANKFNRNTDTISIGDYLNSIIGVLSNIIPENAIQEYILQIVEKCITLSGVFNKNEISDAMILAAVSANDILLTFDAGVIKHLTRSQDAKAKYTNSLKEIQILKGYVSNSGDGNST